MTTTKGNQIYAITFDIGKTVEGKPRTEKIGICLPGNEHYKPIAESIAKVCGLFSEKPMPSSALIDKNSFIERKHNKVLVVYSTASESVEITNFTGDFYWINPEALTLKHLLDPEKATLFADQVYSELMIKVSH